MTIEQNQVEQNRTERNHHHYIWVSLWCSGLGQLNYKFHLCMTIEVNAQPRTHTFSFCVSNCESLSQCLCCAVLCVFSLFLIPLHCRCSLLFDRLVDGPPFYFLLSSFLPSPPRAHFPSLSFGDFIRFYCCIVAKIYQFHGYQLPVRATSFVRHQMFYASTRL